MKLGILHFTDSHIEKSDDWILSQYSNIVSAVKNIYDECNKIYILFTGDIANYGKDEEYLYASKFLLSIKSLLKQIYPDKIYEKIIFTPGNHDCKFDLDNQARRNALRSMNYAYIGDDNSVLDLCLSVQKPYFDFVNKMNNTNILPNIYTEYTDDINGKTIIFHSFNTAWMSSIKEIVGTLFYPVETMKCEINEKSYVNIALFHHHVSWLNPNTEVNNKTEFSNLIANLSDITLYGHEHEQHGMIEKNLDCEKEYSVFSGEALQYLQNKKISSGFQSFVIDIDKREGCNYVYNWNEMMYMNTKKTPFQLKSIGEKNLDFCCKKDYLYRLNEMKLPLFLNENKKIKLADIFIYPDLEKTNELKKDLYENYIDSSTLSQNSTYKIILLEGENQSGKSSLINMLYLSFISLQKFPLLINGKNVNKKDIDKILINSYKEQYGDKTYEQYEQHSNADKILFIDNLDISGLNNRSIFELLNKFRHRFSQIIATTSSMYNIISFSESNSNDILCAKILPLGHKKRNKLIEKYHRLNEDNPDGITEQLFLDKIKNSYEQLQIFLGDKLIPSYPVFILSMLQSINIAKPNNYKQTSYGYCYQSLILFALAKKANIKNEDVDSYINFLVELAYSMFNKDKNSFTEDELLKFYNKYSNQYISPSFLEIKNNIISSSLVIQDDDESFRFGYNYIFYFLIAQKIANLLAEAEDKDKCQEGKEVIKSLCKNLQIDKYANILIFVAHHSKDSFLIDEVVFTSMMSFENVRPITLEKDGFFYKLIEDIANEFKDDIITSNIDPIKEREKRLETQDKLEEETRCVNNEINSNEMPDEIISFHQAVRSLEIVGQIIKNRKGSIPKKKVYEMIKELYLTAFRTIGFLGEMIKSTKEELIISIKANIKEYDSNSKIEERINLFFQLMSFNFCLGIFSRVVSSVGTKELRPLFDEVAQELDTPAAKLISFSIKTYYGKLIISELKSLKKEFEKNPVALRILKARVKSYLYNNYVKYNERQIIASILDMSLNTPKPKSQYIN